MTPNPSTISSDDEERYRKLYGEVLDIGHQIECLNQQLRDQALQFDQMARELVEHSQLIAEQAALVLWLEGERQTK